MAPTVVIEYTNSKNRRHKTCVTMGRTQRFTKGLSSGFIPDYRYAVEEKVDESEGIINAGHIDSEDSSAPKRKCINLNTKRPDVFNVPLQAFLISLMSSSEKKELKRRLREELEQIRQLQEKILSGPVKRTPQSSSFKSSNTALTKQCEQLLKSLLQHPYGWVFKEPVDAVKLNIPDYYTVIKHPMDLGTVKAKLTSRMYSSLSGFASDVRLTFSNAKTYNPPGNDVHTMAEALSNLFESKWKSIEKKVQAVDSKAAKPSPVKKRKAPAVNGKVMGHAVETRNERVTAEEKLKLSSRLESLIPELPDHIIDFLKKNSGNQGQVNEDEIEIDIDALGDSTLHELRKLLDDFCSARKPKADLGEVELLNDSGVSNSLIQPLKGNEHPMDEEVDIMGNDHPVSSYPPVEIEKDSAVGNSKYSSSSRSSSESGSSSSDSESASSSESESLAAANNNVKEMSASHEKAHLIAGNRHVSGGSEQPEQGGDGPNAVASADADDRSEGGHAPFERQVSPEKLYRAALLRSRFADTILKAREKTIDKVDNGDPEKLRRERKELERQQQEERARLQAEARAAEDLRLQVEARAAAESKRQRDLEREAARQALLEMEKTVEIGENGRFIEDLEMLGGAGHQLPSRMEETSAADLSQDGGAVGAFKFGGNNPLEQLGLYMKADEDEDEAEPIAPSNDVEEGEID